MPISLDEFKKGSEITDRKPATDFMQPNTAYSNTYPPLLYQYSYHKLEFL